jgi:hypothetical protein
MDDDALMAIGTVMAVLGGLFERNGICSTMDFANKIGNMALVTRDAGPEYAKRAEYLAGMAHCVLAAAQGRPKDPGEQVN